MNRLNKALNRLHEQLKKQAFPIEDAFRQGLSRQRMEVELASLSLNLPQDAKTLYAWHNGLSGKLASTASFIPGMYFFPFEQSVHLYRQLVDLAQNLASDGMVAINTVWDPAWFPLFQNVGGDNYVTICGEKRQDEGQVLCICNDDRDASYLAYDSIVGMILSTVECYEAGIYKIQKMESIDCDPIRAATIVRKWNPCRTKNLLGEARDAASLVHYLALDDQHVRTSVANKLVLLKDEATIGPVIDLLQADNEDVQSLAMRVLGEIGSNLATGSLLGALRDSNSYMRAEAATALGLIGDPNSVGGLLSALKDADENVRLRAAWALGELGDPAAIPALRECLSGVDGPVQQNAKIAISKLSNNQSI